jgi:hypothetical protein
MFVMFFIASSIVDFGMMVWVWFLTVQDFSVLHSVHTDSGAHPASYPKVPRIPFLRVKWQGRENEHSPPSSAEVKKDGAILPLRVFMA